ncbi:MAG: MotA/TolQ/ExbB proton channel family protein [Candidatus Omnitrophota bacterium]|nr:MotA/TolQ/ExbB proton channel family protein [Candidatus Omnitrophota bacterium]
MTAIQLIMAGGVTIYILIFCSVLSIAIIIERYMYYRSRSRIKRADLMARVKKELEKNDLEAALKICDKKNTPFSNVVHAGLSFAKHTEKEISNNMERTIVVETNLLEKRTTVVGTIGSIAVYIGLFGTVLGIMRAFGDIATAGAGGINVVMNGISESLVCTAAGLCVAVPAVVAYNYFIKRIDNFITDMELCASETMDLVKVKAK